MTRYRVRTGFAAGVMLLVVLAGCARVQPEAERDGVRYGITEGPFRGRWWSYYERGRSFSDGSFWAEAERDFRVALGDRRRDQYWPRTYGLHFTPEYFPHRELGIVLFRRGRVDEAISELESSYAQQPSARAAYYLNEARKRWVSDGARDSQPPALRLTPREDGRIGAITTTIAGVAHDDTFVAAIEINGESVPVAVSAPEVPFEKTVALHPGDNTVEVTVRDLLDNVTRQSVVIPCDVDGPVVSFDSPVVLPGEVRGVAWDLSGIASLRIGDAEAALSTGDDGVTRFQMTVSAVGMNAPPVYQCADTLGNVTGGTLRPDALVSASPWPRAAFAGDGAALEDLGGGLHALRVNGHPVAFMVAQTETEAPPSVAFAGLDASAEQRFWSDELVVAVRIDGAAPIESAALNGEAIRGLIPGRNTQSFSRRVPLPEPGPNEITVDATDSAGRNGSASATVTRELTKVEQLSERLTVALLGDLWEGQNPQQFDEISFLDDAVTRVLLKRGRFQLVSRDLMGEVLTEQQLSATLSSAEQRLALREIVPAELMLVGKMRRDADTLNIVMQAVSNETGLIMGLADVTGPADSPEALDALAADLVVRIEQEFPRVQGVVAQVRDGGRLVTTLSQADRLRPSMKCVLFRKGEAVPNPITGELLEGDCDILGQGFLDDVKSNSATVNLIIPEGAEPKSIEVRDLVITK